MENWKSKFICNNPEFQGTRKEKKKFVFLRSHYTSRGSLPSNGTYGLTRSCWRMGTTHWVWILVYYKVLADGSSIILGFLLYSLIIGQRSKPDIIKLNSFLISEFDAHDFKVVKKMLGIEVHCARWAGNYGYLKVLE